MPEVDVALTHKKTGAPRAPNAIAHDRERKSMQAQRQQRADAAPALPVHIATDGRPGGAHTQALAWTPDEDADLLSILPFNIGRPSWSEVTRKLTNATGNQRTLKSVRCRWNRLRGGRLAALASENDPSRAKNRCRICGLFKRGHVCRGPAAVQTEVNTDPTHSPAPTEKSVPTHQQYRRLRRRIDNLEKLIYSTMHFGEVLED